jgi:acetyl esterase/lipase
MRRLLPLLLLLAIAAGCGGGGPPRVKEEGPIGLAADQYWLFLPETKPRSIVLFLHGLHTSELEPDNHRPWLRHLAEQGNAVVYPRYELNPGTFGALKHIVVATRAALQRLDFPDVPLVVIGYSRGGRLAVESAALLPGLGRPPAAVMSVFPGLLNPYAEERIDLGSIDRSTRIQMLAGDRDRSVSSDGAKALLDRLEIAGFPARNVEAVLVKSREGFVADHVAPLGTSEQARAEFWGRADRLIESARDG